MRKLRHREYPVPHRLVAGSYRKNNSWKRKHCIIFTIFNTFLMAFPMNLETVFCPWTSYTVQPWYECRHHYCTRVQRPLTLTGWSSSAAPWLFCSWSVHSDLVWGHLCLLGGGRWGVTSTSEPSFLLRWQLCLDRTSWSLKDEETLKENKFT